jgi:hypothetical protein
MTDRRTFLKNSIVAMSLGAYFGKAGAMIQESGRFKEHQEWVFRRASAN